MSPNGLERTGSALLVSCLGLSMTAHAAEIPLVGENADGIPVVSVAGDFVERGVEVLKATAADDVVSDPHTAFSKGQNASALDNFVEAARWFRMAAEQGHAEAQVELGYIYAEGQGVSQDHVEAVRWFRLAAEQGNADGQNSLGVRYDLGEGVARDHIMAMLWYLRAAEHGDPYAQVNIGLLYRDGHGVIQNEAEAIRWFRKAAEQGHDEAEEELRLLGVR